MQHRFDYTARVASVHGAIPVARLRRAPHRWRRQDVVLLASIAALQITRPAHAQTDFWNGGNGDWNVAANWSSGIPNASSNAENDTSGTITFSSGMDVVNSFLNTFSGGFNLTGGTLSTTTTFKNSGSGQITLSGGTLNVGTDFINSGSGAVTVSGATLNVTGSFLNSSMGALTFSSGSTAIGSNLQSAGALSLTGGMLSGSGAATSTVEVDNTFTIDGGTLKGFTVKPGSGGQGVTFTTNTNNTLSGVVMNANMDLNTLPLWPASLTA